MAQDWEIVFSCHVFWIHEGGHRETVDFLTLATFKDWVIPRVGDTIALDTDTGEAAEVVEVVLDYSKRRATVYVEASLEDWYFTDADMAELLNRLRSLRSHLECHAGT